MKRCQSRLSPPSGPRKRRLRGGNWRLEREFRLSLVESRRKPGVWPPFARYLLHFITKLICAYRDFRSIFRRDQGGLEPGDQDFGVVLQGNDDIRGILVSRVVLKLKENLLETEGYKVAFFHKKLGGKE